MPLIEFTDAFRWKISPQAVQRFCKGQVVMVPRACARLAKDAGVAVDHAKLEDGERDDATGQDPKPRTA
jgi:hypothetical protein